MICGVELYCPVFSQKMRFVHVLPIRHYQSAVARFFAYVALMSLTPLFAQTKSPATDDTPRRCLLPGIPAQRVSEVVNSISLLPAPLGADT